MTLIAKVKNLIENFKVFNLINTALIRSILGRVKMKVLGPIAHYLTLGKLVSLT